MKGKEPLTLAQMAARSATGANGRMACWKCGCIDFLAKRTKEGVVVTFRYRVCRNCGTKYFTEQPPEKILRVVEPRKKPGDEQSGDAQELDENIV